MSLHRSASPDAGKGRKGGLAAVVIGLGLLAAAAFVPLRTCEKCHGIAGVKIGEVVDLRCNGCGGKGKQTLLDIALAGVRK